MKKIWIGMCMLVLLLLPVAVAQAAQSAYISDVKMASESEDVSTLVVGGYTPISPSVGERNVAYRTTSSAGSAATEIVYDNGSFHCKSGTGDPVVRLYFDTSKDVFAIPNNGAVPVKNGAGEPVRFHAGGGSAYLMQVRENIWKPYITNLQIARGGTKSGAIEKLAGLGCEYYVDEDYGEDSSESVFIGYSRTDSESEGITDIIGRKEEDESIPGYKQVSDRKVSGLYLYESNDDAMGNTLTGIDSGFGKETFTISSKMLTEIAISNGNATMTKQYLTGSEGYDSFVESDTLYLVAPMDTDEKKGAGIALISAEAGLEEKRAAKLESLNGMTSEDEAEEAADEDSGEVTEESVDGEDDGEPVDGEESAPSDETAAEEEEAAPDRSETDELTEPQPGIEEEETQDSGDENAYAEGGDAQQGTVLATLGAVGAGIFFAVMIGIAILLPVVFILIRRRVIKKANANPEGEREN